MLKMFVKAIQRTLMTCRRHKPFELVQKCANQLAVIAVNSPRTGFSPNFTHIWNNAKLRLCTDGAANSLVEPCRANDLKSPDLIVGDFDSITNEAMKFFMGQANCQLIHCMDQDSTDLTKTFRMLMKTVSDEHSQLAGVILLGGLSGRFDHVLGVLNTLLLQTQSTPDLPVYALDGHNFVTVLPQGEALFELSSRHITGTCGLAPIVQRKTVVDTTGLRWELKGTELEYGGVVSTSNRILRPEALQIRCSNPLVFTFELKEADGLL